MKKTNKTSLIAASIWTLIAAFFIVFASTQGFGCRKSTNKVPLNILFIFVDTLRADHVGAYGYERNTTPRLDELAKDAALFERAYSHSPWTMPSAASMFTSLEPRDHGIKDWLQPLSTRHLTLAEHLRDNGYTTEAIVSHITFKEVYNFDQGFEKYDASVLDKGKTKFISTSKEVSDLAVQALEADHDKPFFLWLHYFDPHNDYLPHDGFEFGENDIDLYDGEIAFTDAHIGRVLDKLKEKGLYENTIIVFIADHGEEFRDHGGRKHTNTLYEELIHIPLIIRVPGFKPQRIETIVTESDVAPTLCKLAGVPIPEQFKGIPLVYGNKSFEDKNNRVVFAETFARGNRKIGVLRDNHKLIHDLKKERFFLFDLDQDPAEKDNLAEKRTDVFQQLLADLKEHNTIQPADVENIEIPENIMKELQSLGYIN